MRVRLNCAAVGRGLWASIPRVTQRVSAPRGSWASTESPPRDWNMSRIGVRRMSVCDTTVVEGTTDIALPAMAVTCHLNDGETRTALLLRLFACWESGETANEGDVAMFCTLTTLEVTHEQQVAVDLELATSVDATHSPVFVCFFFLLHSLRD
eukprot:Opistho-2@7902